MISPVLCMELIVIHYRGFCRRLTGLITDRWRDGKNGGLKPANICHHAERNRMEMI